MSNIALQFDARTVPPEQALDPVPADTYKATIVDTEIAPNRAHTGNMLVITNQIAEGPYAGRKIIDRLNLDNPSAQAVDIAYKRLSAICHALNVFPMTQTSQLFGIPFALSVNISPAGVDDTGKPYNASNRVTRYASLNAAAAPAFAGAPAAPFAAPAFAPPAPAFAAPAAPAFAAPPAPAFAAPAAPAAPVFAAPPPPAAPAPPAPPAAGLTMLPAASGTPYEAYRAAGWSDEQLIAQGLAMKANGAAGHAPFAAPAAPAAPAVPGAPGAMPPWTPR